MSLNASFFIGVLHAMLSFHMSFNIRIPAEGSITNVAQLLLNLEVDSFDMGGEYRSVTECL